MLFMKETLSTDQKPDVSVDSFITDLHWLTDSVNMVIYTPNYTGM